GDDQEVDCRVGKAKRAHAAPRLPGTCCPRWHASLCPPCKRWGPVMSKDLRNGGLDGLTVEDILQPGFSTPWDAPTIPPFPFTFRSVEVLTLVWRTTAAAVDRVLPPPLEAASDVVLTHIYKMNDTEWLGPYGESNVSVGCRLPSAG